MEALLAALLKVITDVIVGLLDREDFVADEIEPELETMGLDVSDADLLRRYGGLLDAD
jgi:hypothetical protein